MRILNRGFLLLLCAVLLGTVLLMHFGTTQVDHHHDTYYLSQYHALLPVRQWSLLCVVAWCILFVKSEPGFVRIGLVVIFLALIIMALPFRNGPGRITSPPAASSPPV